MTQTGYHIVNPDFETLYIRLRRQERRIYSDEELIDLPNIQTTHPHYKEWQLRKHSSEKLFSYLKRKNKSLDILEIGCGNGWLSHRLSIIPGGKVIGTDINFTEIQQAARVFQHIPNLHFIHYQKCCRLNSVHGIIMNRLVFVKWLIFIFIIAWMNCRDMIIRSSPILKACSINYPVIKIRFTGFASGQLILKCLPNQYITLINVIALYKPM